MSWACRSLPLIWWSLDVLCIKLDVLHQQDSVQDQLHCFSLYHLFPESCWGVIVAHQVDLLQMKCTRFFYSDANQKRLLQVLGSSQGFGTKLTKLHDRGLLHLIAIDKVLTEYMVQDLNVNPQLPFEDRSFDVITNV
ncbi:hypothetical protein Droror1_Dr00006497, partial [Drosera rotundifolia]